MNIRVDLNTPIKDGTEVVFRSPVDCSQITGLIVYYQENGNTASKEFAFADAHGNDVGNIDHLFAENAVVKVILDLDANMAFVQNADTNAYLEGRFQNIFEALSASAVECEATGDVIAVNEASNNRLRGLNIYGKTTQDGTPTPEAPVEMVTAGNSGVITVKVLGTKNLFGGEALADKIVSFGGQKGEDSMGRFVTIDAEKIAGKTIFDDFDENKWYYVALYGQNTSGTRATNIGVFYESGRIKQPNFPEDFTVGYSDTNITDKGFGSFKLIGYHSSGTTKLYYDKCGIFEWWTPGFVFENEFEPYKGKTLTAYTPNGLPGIPVDPAMGVSVSPDYTDENGRGWFCDVIDFARGVYIQRIVTEVLDGTGTWRRVSGKYHAHTVGAYGSVVGGVQISDKYPGVRISSSNSTQGIYSVNSEGTNSSMISIRYGGSESMSVDEFKAWLAENPVTVLYALSKPNEIPLSAEELAAYAELHTNYPNTTIYNDAGAGLGVKYVADTKLYFDNKFTELQNAILSAGANV